LFPYLVLEHSDSNRVLVYFTPIKLTDDVIKKIRALKEKKKSTIMLPMGMPSKRGRGSAIAMHSSSTSEKIQKMMASSLNENSAVKLKTYPPDASLSKVEHCYSTTTSTF
jgi:hypothetical protein